MMLRPYKFQVVAVCQQYDGDRLVGEVTVSPKGAPFEVFGIEGLGEFAESFEARLAELEQP